MADDAVDQLPDVRRPLRESYPFEEERLSPAACSLVLREPVGVAVAIPPFNGPLTLGTQKAAPALAAGCTVILKAPVQNGLACYVFAEAVEEAGLPPGVVNVLVADAAESERLVTHPGVDKVSFTGSTPGGQAHRRALRSRHPPRHARAGRQVRGDHARRRRRREGGAGDHRAAASRCSRARSARPSRAILAPRARYDEIVDAFAEQIAALPVGDPADRDMVIGPMITSAHRERVEDYIRIGAEEGATVKVGGGRPAHLDRGWYVEPTLLRRRHERHARRARGDLRSGRGRHPARRRRRRDRDRQRLAVRPVGHRVDRGRGRRARRSRAAFAPARSR